MGLHTECSDGALMVCNKKKGNCQHEDQSLPEFTAQEVHDYVHYFLCLLCQAMIISKGLHDERPFL